MTLTEQPPQLPVPDTTARALAAGRVQLVFTAVALVMIATVTTYRLANSAAIWDGGMGLYLAAFAVGFGWLTVMAITIWLAPLRTSASALAVMAVALNAAALAERIADTGGLLLEVRLAAAFAICIWLLWATWASIRARIDADRLAWAIGAAAFVLLIAAFFVAPSLDPLLID